MKKINTILEIINKYENYIIDQWGVIHDGKIAYKHAVQTINFLKKNNKNLFIISNSSKRKKHIEEKLNKLGFEKKSFIDIATSGEIVWQMLYKKYVNLKYKKKCFHIYDNTKEDSLIYREGLNLTFVDKIENADLILACTPFANMQPIDYIPILDKAIDKKLIMYCANPDYETVHKDKNKNLFCMGVIAEIYENMGGKVIIKGKPDKEIYMENTKMVKLDKSKTIAIGDSIFHDIKGAINFSIDSILVKSGIHKDLKSINMLCKIHQIAPTYLINDFSI